LYQVLFICIINKFAIIQKFIFSCIIDVLLLQCGTQDTPKPRKQEKIVGKTVIKQPQIKKAFLAQTFIIIRT